MGPLFDLQMEGKKGHYVIHQGIWSYGCSGAFAAELSYILTIC